MVSPLKSHLINQNFLCSPSQHQRSLHMPLSKHKCKNIEFATEPSYIFERSLKVPFPHFPLEIPRVSRVSYKPNQSILHKRWLSQRMSSQDSSASNDLLFPMLSKQQSTRNSSLSNAKPGKENKKWEFTEKVQYNRRKIPDFPLVIIVFEGVIGDFYKKSLWDARASDMALCFGWCKGIEKIYQKAYVVVVSSSDSEKIGFICQLFQYKNVKVDGIYRRIGMQPGYFQDYSQIFHDFQVKTALVVSSLGLDIEEINTRQAWSILYEPSLSSDKKILAKMCPLSQFSNIKQNLLLVPNPRGQNLELAIHFTAVSSLIKKMLKKNQCLHEIAEEFNSEMTGIKSFKLGFKDFGIESTEKIQVFIFTGQENDRKPYLRYHLNNMKIQIELNKSKN